MNDRLQLLRSQLKKQKLDGFILPVNDEYMGEYVPESAKRLTWLTGFTGSAGMAVVLKDKAAFFTDGRYTLQAKTEVGQGFELYNSGELSPEHWLVKAADKKALIGYDPKLHTLQALERYELATSLSWKALLPNPIDALWEDRPPAPETLLRMHAPELAGQTSAAKRAHIAKELAAKNIDVAILSAPDSICWLCNIRGKDVPFTPFILCYALLTKTGEVALYVDKGRVFAVVERYLGEGVIIKPPEALEGDLAALGKKRVLYDRANSPVWFYQQLAAAGANIIEGSDPCVLPKACKNTAELEGMRRAHIRDGLAITKFLYWLDNTEKKKLTEMDIAAKLESFRKQSELYREPSFTTISGSGPNGAIVHYRVTNESNRKLDNNSLLLLDSGGQYPDGTTDITRTIALGKPTAEMKDRFTRVLKGHIALARATFPHGTSGSQLDALARQYLWAEGLDYDHGTGHGVGSYLSVHEGPQRISKRGGDAILKPGMIISNEPGYYKTGAYGIRIESLVIVKEIEKSVEGKAFLGFETITLAPIDKRVIDMKLLTHDESEWLKDYHAIVYKTHAPHLDAAQKKWLKTTCDC